MVKVESCETSQQSSGTPEPDPAWRVLYRVDGVSAWVFVAMLVVAIAASFGRAETAAAAVLPRRGAANRLGSVACSTPP